MRLLPLRRSSAFAEQRLVKRVSAREIEGKQIAILGRVIERHIQELGAFACFVAIPRFGVEPTAKRRHFAREGRRSKFATDPAQVYLRSRPRRRFLRAWASIVRRVEEKDERLIGAKQGLHVLNR